MVQSIIKTYGSQVSWNALHQHTSIQHTQTLIDYVQIFENIVFAGSAFEVVKSLMRPQIICAKDIQLILEYSNRGYQIYITGINRFNEFPKEDNIQTFMNLPFEKKDLQAIKKKIVWYQVE